MIQTRPPRIERCFPDDWEGTLPFAQALPGARTSVDPRLVLVAAALVLASLVLGLT